MTSTKSDLVDLLTFNDWATRLLLEAVAELSPDEWTKEVGGSFGTIQRTVAHLVGAEWIWLERWKGASPTSPPDWSRTSDATTLAGRWEAVAAERGEWMAMRSDRELGAVVSYHRLNGEPGGTRLDVLIRHVVNHSTFHRGQVIAFLRSLGKTPPSTDLVLWDLLRSG